MDEILGVCVGKFLRRAVLNFGEDQGREGGCLRCCGRGMFREDGGTVGDAGAR